MMPKKGRKNALDVEGKRKPRWLKLKDQHSEVESNINTWTRPLSGQRTQRLQSLRRAWGLGLQSAQNRQRPVERQLEVPGNDN